ncbi:uncharacterized protein PgNI_00027, partial [Pyricularia grisea]|uniref:Uncharacterized protein n=1 Tax=Pyricularia grisea TaxID=148305 RepID=A0A6P8BKL6_PYRGI
PVVLNSPKTQSFLRPDAITNQTVKNAEVTSLTEMVGWVSSSRDRGTVDILRSSCLTIFLCVWIATYPYIPSINDKWYHRFIDKANMACIGFLGPDFLFGLAIGQLASARRSVKIFRDSNLVPERQSWTLSHGFFADMGGFQLKAPDFPNGFPINAEQLFYLVKHGHLDFPVLTKEEICQRSRVDELSRIITIWQALWFTITEVQRVANGYPMTTLELTAISFAVVMMATSGSWYFKPSITQATYLNTKNQRTVKLIRKHARSTTLYRAASFHIDKHWSYYCELSHKFKVPLFNRRMTTTPWDRFPSELWFPVDGWIIPFGLAVQVPFCVCFLVAWDFHFPTAHQSSFSGGFARSITPCSLSSALDTTCLVPSETLREWCPYQVLHPASAQSQHHRRPLPHNQQVSSATKRP